MTQALELCGILDARRNGVAQTTYKFVTEPEAASMAAIPEIERSNSLSLGDSFMVADVGGGTVVCFVKFAQSSILTRTGLH